MAVVIGGAGLGNFDVLGQAGIKLSGKNGVNVNASTGNLVLSGRDHVFVSQGLDLSLARTYNSQGGLNDFNGDNWRFSFEKELKVVGNTIQRITGDGHVSTFEKQADGSYLSFAGAGAHDTIHKVGDNWVYTEGTSGVTEHYRVSDGRLLSSKDKHENTVNYAYDGNKLTRIQGAGGEELRLIYNAQGMLTRLDSYTKENDQLAHSQSAVYYQYDAKNRLSQVTVDLSPQDKSITDGHVFTTNYAYQNDTSHLLKSITKSDGSAIHFSYETHDGKTRLTRLDDNGIVTQFDYQGSRQNGHQLAVTDNNGEVWYYQHDDKGRLVSTLSPTVDYQSNVANLPRSYGQQNGVTQYQYDDQDNLISVQDATGRDIQNKYDLNGNLTHVLRNGVLQYTHEYENNQRVATHSYQEGQVKHSAYYVYNQGNLVFEISAMGRVTEHSYNGFGERISMREYYGANYSAAARPTFADMSSWASDQNKQLSQLTEYSYQRGELYTQTTYKTLDTEGHGHTITTAGNAEHIRTVYDAFGNLLSTQTLTGDLATGQLTLHSSTTQVYDGLNRVISKTDAAGQTITTQYLDSSRQVLITTANQVTTSRTFTHTGELLTETVSASGEISRERSFLYNASGQLVATTHANGSRNIQFYDDTGRLWIAVSETGQVTEYQRDSLGRIIREIQYNSQLTTDNWIAQGALTVSGNDVLGLIDANAEHRVTHTDYDALGRLLRVTDGEQQVVEYVYDEQDRQTEIRHYQVGHASSATVIAKTYNADGQLESQTDQQGFVTEYVYDGVGNLIEQRVTGNGQVDRLQTFYDSRGRVQFVLDAQGYLTQTRYLEAGREKVVYRYSEAVSNRDGGINSLLQQAGTPVQISREVKDAAGRLVSNTDIYGNQTQYHYDQVTGLLRQQITAANTTDSRSVYFNYNQFGEQTGIVSVDGAQDWKSANVANLVTQKGITSTYNVMGWKTSETHPATGRVEFKYDNLGRLVEKKNAKGTVNKNAYNAFGELNQTLVNGVVKSELAYDKAGRLVAEKNGVGVETTYLYNHQGKVSHEIRQHVSEAYDAIKGNTGSMVRRNITQYLYDARGNVIERLVAQDQRAGSGISGANSRADVSSSKVRYSSQWTRKYDHQGRLVSETDAAGREKVVDYLLGGRVKTVKLSGALQERIELDALGRTLSIANGAGQKTVYQYDDNRNSVTQISPGGVRTVTEKNAHGETLSVTDGEGNKRVFHYNHNGKVTKTEFFATGSQTAEVLSHNEYDSHTGLLRFSTDAEGTRTEYKYNVIGQQWKVIYDADGEKLTTEYGYDSQGQKIWENSEGQTTHITYDNAGQQLRVERAGIATVYEYDLYGQVLRKIEGEVVGQNVREERVTEYSYDAEQNVTQTRVRSGHDWTGTHSSQTTKYNYDATGNIIEKSTGVGTVTRYIYDDLGRVQYEVNALRYVTEYQYDEANRKTHTIRYHSQIDSQLNWDSASIAAALKPSSLDRSTEIQYDQDGRVAYQIDAKKMATGYEYDDRGLVIRTTQYAKPTTDLNWDAPSTQHRVSESIYDAHGRLQYSIDAQGRISERGYDKEGRITHTIAYDTEFTLVTRSDASIAALQTHLSAEVAAGNVRAELSVYDTLGRKRFTLDADGYLVEYQYNRQSQLTRKREYVDNQSVLTALNDIRSGQAALTEYETFVTLVQGLQTLENASAELRAQLAELNHQQSRITGLYTELSVLEQQIATTTNANHDLGTSIENANQRLLGLQKEVEAELARHTELQQKIDLLGAEIAEQEARLKLQNDQAVSQAQAAVASAEAALTEANTTKHETLAKVRGYTNDPRVLMLKAEWQEHYTSQTGLIWTSVTGDAEAQSALTMIAGHRDSLVAEKIALQEQHSSALANGTSTTDIETKLNQVIDVLEMLDQLGADIHSDMTARMNIVSREINLDAAKTARAQALANQSETNTAIDNTPSMGADGSTAAINKGTANSNDPTTPTTNNGSTTQLLDKIDALKSTIQVLTADIDAQKTNVDIKASELALREKEYAVARAAFNQSQAERQAEIDTAQAAVDTAQATRNAAWATYQSALASKETKNAEFITAQNAYNEAKSAHDKALSARNSAQSAADSANSALASANSLLSSKTSAYNTANSNYNYHHNEWVKADNHYKSTVASRDAAWRTRDSRRRAYEAAVNSYNSYNRKAWWTEERPSGKTSSGLRARENTRNARLREYQAAINSHNTWVSRTNSAASTRTAKWNTRASYLKTRDAALAALNSAKAKQASAQTAANNANAVLEAAIKAHEATVTPYESATAAYQAATTAKNEANTRFTHANTAWNQAETVLSAKKQILQDKIATPQEQVDKAQAILNAAIAEKNTAEAAVNGFTATKQSLASQIATLTPKVTGAQGVFDAAAAHYQTIKTNFDKAQQTLTSAESDKRNKTSALTSAEGRLATIDSDISKAQSDYNAAVAQIPGATSRVNSARSSYNSAQSAYNKAVAGRHRTEEGVYYGTSLATINSARSRRDSALSTLRARESELNSWVSKRNTASSNVSRLNASRPAAVTAVDTATKNFNASLIVLTEARNAFNAISPELEAAVNAHSQAQAEVDSLNSQMLQLESELAQASDSLVAAQARKTAAIQALNSAQATLDSMTSMAIGDAETALQEKNTRLALQAAQSENQAAIESLNSLQAQRDAALTEQTQLMQTLTQSGSGSQTLIDATVDSIDSANTARTQAERDMLANQKKVSDLQGTLKTLSDNIELQRSELEKQKRNYEEKLTAHASSSQKVQDLVDQLSNENSKRVNTFAQIMSWEDTKRAGAHTIKATELALTSASITQNQQQGNFTSASALLSSNKAIQVQRQQDLANSKAALEQARKDLIAAVNNESAARTAISNDMAWSNELWLLQEEHRRLNSEYQTALNNPQRTLSEEQGGKTVGNSPAQIQAAKNRRDAAARRVSDFQREISGGSSIVYTGDAAAAKSRLSAWRGELNAHYANHNNIYNNATTAKNINEEGNVTGNRYSQAQINTFRRNRDIGRNAIAHLDAMVQKLQTSATAKIAKQEAQNTVNRLEQQVVSRESALVTATQNVDKAQTDFNTAQSALEKANQDLALAKQSVTDAHQAMDQAEVSLKEARLLMDGVEASIDTIRGLLDIAKADEARALAAVVAARSEWNKAQGNLNAAKGELNTTIGFLNTAYNDLETASALHSQVSNYLDRASTYKNRAGDTLSEAQQLVYLSTLSVTRDINAGTVSNDTDYRYDARGQLASELTAMVSFAEFSNDGSLVQHIGRLETQHRYDSLGNVIETITAAGTSMANSQRFEFNVMGDQTKAIGLAGSSVIYNDQSLATVNINAENGRRDRVYDQLGRLRFEVDELGFVTEHKYNSFGQKTDQTRHSNAYHLPRPNGQSLKLQDLESFVKNAGESRTIRSVYDNAGREISRTQLSSQNSDTIKDVIEHNQFGEKIATSRQYQGETKITGQVLYSLSGQKLFSMDAKGYVTAYRYNGFGELQSQVEYANAYTDPSSANPKSWSLDAVSSWITQPEAGNVRTVSYTYDKRGNTLTSTRHDVVYHGYDKNNNVVEKVQDITTTTYHDYASRMYMSVQEEGVVSPDTHANNPSRQLFEYDALGRLVSAWSKEREYVNSGLALSVSGGTQPTRLKANLRTDYLYDAQGNQIGVLNQGRSTYQYYNAKGQLTGRKDAQGNYTAIQTDAMNRVVKETTRVSASGKLSYAFDKVTEFEYDKTGRQTATMVDSSSGKIKESLSHNAFGEVTAKRHTSANANAVQESYSYDGFGRVASATRKGITTRYQYNWLDKVTVETEGDIRVTRREYDNLGHLTKEEGVTAAGLTPVTKQTFDRYGNVLTRTVNGAEYRFKYNASNQTIEQLSPSVETVQSNGNIVSKRAITKMYYDHNGNQVALQDGNGHWTKSFYDTSGQKLAYTTSEGLTTYFYHNAHGETVGKINAAGKGEVYTYDNNGNLLTRGRLELSNRFIEVYEAYAYDQAGQRYSEERLGKVATTQWTRFDQAGRVLETIGGGEHRTYEYDSFGNRTREAWLESGQEKAHKSATFNTYGVQTSETWLDGTKVSYQYDALGNVTRKHGGNLDIRFDYYSNGLLKSQTLGAKSESYEYDVNGKQTKRTLTDGTNQLETHTRWDSLGRLTSLSTITPAGFNKTLESAQVRYYYDAAGNRRKVVSERGNGTALKADGNVNWTKVTGSETQWYRYDGDNRMVESHLGATDTGSIDGKAGSRRIVYNQSGQKVQEVVWKSVVRDNVRAVVKERTEIGYDLHGHLNSAQVFEYASDNNRYYATRHVTKTNSATGYALEQRENNTRYRYSNGYIINGSGSTTHTRTVFSYLDGRQIGQSYYEGSTLKHDVALDYHFSGQVSSQKTNVISEGFTDTLSYRYEKKDSFLKVKTTLERNKSGFKAGVTDFHYNPAGQLSSVTSTKGESERKVLTDFNGQIALQLSGGKLTAELAVNGNPLAQLTESKLNADLLSDSAANAGTQPGAYTVKANDTLQRISQMVFGDSRYWYLIADANGLSPSDALVEGKTLVIPNQHTQTYNSAESFKPYNESEVLGDVNPDPIAPPPPRKSCNPIAAIIMTVFAVVISIYFPVVGGGIAGAMLKGAAVSIGTQLVGKALGVIDEFSWKQVALSAVTGGVMKGVGLDKIESLSQTQTAIASAAVGYATNYVGSKALGMDVSFSWKNLAGAVGGALVGGQLKQAGLIDTGNQIVDDTLLGFATDISDTAIRGDSVSDNAAQIGLDAFGNALGNSVVRAHRTSTERSANLEAGKAGLTEQQLNTLQQRAIDHDMSLDDLLIARGQEARYGYLDDPSGRFVDGENYTLAAVNTKPRDVKKEYLQYFLSDYPLCNPDGSEPIDFGGWDDKEVTGVPSGIHREVRSRNYTKMLHATVGTSEWSVTGFRNWEFSPDPIGASVPGSYRPHIGEPGAGVNLKGDVYRYDYEEIELQKIRMDLELTEYSQTLKWRTSNGEVKTLSEPCYSYGVDFTEVGKPYLETYQTPNKMGTLTMPLPAPSYPFKVK